MTVAARLKESEMSGAEAVDESVSAKVKKGFYILLGTLALALGAVGLFIPVLPTTPLVILAAACYFRGSERLYNWVLDTELFGETIRNYRAGRGLTRGTKIRAVGLMWAVILLSAFLFVENILIRVSLIGIAAAVSAYLMRLPTYDG